MVELEPGEWIRAIDSGGSGYGDPATRSPELVRKDVEERYVSIDRAREIYGVVIRHTPETDLFAIDEVATTVLRAELASRPR
jgi:N-methylhydantoinase B